MEFAKLEARNPKFETCIQLVSATLGLEDFRRGFESETFSRTVIEPGFDVC